MSDISMCSNKECPLKQKCHRFTATPNEYRQAYGSFKFKKTSDNQITCEYYWDNKDWLKK